MAASRRKAIPPPSTNQYSSYPTSTYPTMQLDIDSTDPYGLGQSAYPTEEIPYSPSNYDHVSSYDHAYQEGAQEIQSMYRSNTPPRYEIPTSVTPVRSLSPATAYNDGETPAYYQGPPAQVPPPNFYEQYPLNGNQDIFADPSADPEKGYYEEEDEEEKPSNILQKLRRKATHVSSRSGKTYDTGEEGDSDDEKDLNRHYGPAPEHPVARRNKTKKSIPLTHGNVVIDCPIPTKLMGFLPRKDQEEFRFMRYTAVTCDPDDFEKSSFTIRPAIYNRETQLMIAITMYNEDEVLFCRTLHYVMKNIAHLCSREKSKTWGKDGWKKVVVCIISDGRKAIHPRVLDCLAALGVYQEGVAKNVVQQDGEDKVVQAHVYEYTTQLSVDPNIKFKGLEKGIMPTQIIFCLKEKNAKKINSHRWFFNAFAPLLQPTVCVLLDVGTKPGPKSLYYLWKTFDLNSNVGGACGEIVTMKGKLGLGLLNPLVAAQNFEYKMSNILDKPTESLFGYISVLPGAFSAYRYRALQNDALDRGPLASYFKGETLAGHEADVFTSNMYLAEDRILCWELVAKRNHSWVLKYVKSAQGETDVPDRVPEWISQRRRWLNGSFFAAVYALSHVLQLFSTDHSKWRIFWLFVESIYNLFNLIFAYVMLFISRGSYVLSHTLTSWFGIANYYIFFVILTAGLEDPAFKLGNIGILNTAAQWLYLGTLVATFLFSLGNRPQASPWKYTSVMVSFAALTVYMIVAAAFCIRNAVSGWGDSSMLAQIIISLIATYGCYVLSSLIALDPWHLITSMAQYLLMAPVFINVLNTFAFSNLQDLSWGTKDIHQVDKDLGVVVANGKDNKVDIVLPTAQADIDGGYDDALHKLRTRPKIIPRLKTQKEKDLDREDYYKNVRTNVLLVWVLTNAIVAGFILDTDLQSTFDKDSGPTRARIYMIIILGFVSLMSLIRFIGSTGYQIMRLFQG